MRGTGLLKLGSPDWDLRGPNKWAAESRPKGPDLENQEGRIFSKEPRGLRRRGLLASADKPILEAIPMNTATTPVPHVVMPGNTGV